MPHDLDLERRYDEAKIQRCSPTASGNVELMADANSRTNPPNFVSAFRGDDRNAGCMGPQMMGVCDDF